MTNFYTALWGGFPDLTINIDELVGEGDDVVWRVAASGTHNGPFQGVPATGKSVKFGAHYTFRFKHGKIVERGSTIDRLSVLAQTGAVSHVGATHGLRLGSQIATSLRTSQAE